MNIMPLTLHRAVQRDRWLAELATALEEAGKLTLLHRDNSEATVLRAQILALRAEVDSIQRRRQSESDEMHPDWMH